MHILYLLAFVWSVTSVNVVRGDASSMPPETANAFRLLDTHNDARDFVSQMEDAIVKRDTAIAAEETYRDLHDRNTQLLGRGAISKQDWESSLLMRDSAIAEVRVWKEKLIEVTARKVARDYITKNARGQQTIDADTLYKLYRDIWDSECRRTKDDIAFSAATLRLAAFKYDLVRKLVPSAAASYFELMLRRKEYAAAIADLASKKRLDATCYNDLPTLDEVRAVATVKPKKTETR